MFYENTAPGNATSVDNEKPAKMIVMIIRIVYHFSLFYINRSTPSLMTTIIVKTPY